MPDLYQAERHALESLSLAAEQYARDVYRVTLDPDHLNLLDRLLLSEAMRHHQERMTVNEASQSIPWLVSCMGAWLGQAAVHRFGAQWVDLAERHAPRLMVAGIPVSPMDAIERLLLQDSNAILPSEMFRHFHSWTERAQRLSRAAATANQRAWDQLAEHPRFVELASIAPVATQASFTSQEAIEGLDPWLRKLWRPSLKVLCLAAGGGRHGPPLARAGAQVTIVDISESQLQVDRRWSDTSGIPLRCLHGSIDDLSMLQGETFDIVIQPVSSCYLADPIAVYRQVAQLTKPGAIYLSQHKVAPSMLVNNTTVQQLAFEPLVAGEGPLEPLPIDSARPNREPQTIEFAHGLETLLGGLCREGFAITAILEPCLADAFAPVGSEAWQACFVKPFVKVRCERL